MTAENIRSLFPVFRHQPGLVYADNAATTQRPAAVIEAMANYESHGVANAHRGLYALAEEATRVAEIARLKTAGFLHAANQHCIAFTKSTTESINAVAFGFLLHRLKPGDEVIVTAMEHHANLIPWQQVCCMKQATLKILPVSDQGNLLTGQLDSLISPRARMLAITHISNTLGTINPIEDIITLAHCHDIPVLIDAAQSISSHEVHVEKLKPDFLAFSAHKMFGPFGVGVLYAAPKYHQFIQPLLYGGGSVREVTWEDASFKDFPYNLEAGTMNITGLAGLTAAINFIESLPADWLIHHPNRLAELLMQGLSAIPQYRIIGLPVSRGSIVSFVHDSIHPHDIATLLSAKNIAVRAGHHCTQPLLDQLGLGATVRISFTAYNTEEEVYRILQALAEINQCW